MSYKIYVFLFLMVGQAWSGAIETLKTLTNTVISDAQPEKASTKIETLLNHGGFRDLAALGAKAYATADEEKVMIRALLAAEIKGQHLVFLDQEPKTHHAALACISVAAQHYLHTDPKPTEAALRAHTLKALQGKVDDKELPALVTKFVTKKGLIKPLEGLHQRMTKGVVIDSSDEEFKEDVLQAPGLVLVDFHATWCGPCKMLSPILIALAKERPDIKVVKVDVGKDHAIAEDYKVAAMPTLILFKDGQEISRKVGGQSKAALTAWVNSPNPATR